MPFKFKLSRRLAVLLGGLAFVVGLSPACEITRPMLTGPVQLARVIISPDSLLLHLDDSTDFAVLGVTQAGDTIAPAVSWQAATGTVTETGGNNGRRLGHYRPRRAGRDEIVATDQTSGLADTAVVVVVTVASVDVAPTTSNLVVGQAAQLTATAKDSSGNSLNGLSVTWSSMAPSVATVSASGIATAMGVGTAPITATIGSKSGTATVSVSLAPVATVTVTPATASVEQGRTVQLSATLKDASGNTLTGRPVTWATLGAGVATVSSAGTVTGVTVGVATITATSEGKVGTAAVSVTAPPPPGTRVGYYVTPGGSSGGDGSMARPWDLRTALSGASGRIRAGDTVWVRAGTYSGSFTSSLAGTSTAPIVLRAYPGERAVIDGNGSSGSTFVVDGQWAVYWGLEIMNSMTARYGAGLGLRGTGVYVRNANNVKLVNLIVHDTGHGTYTEYTAQNIEIYGWIIFNGGHQNSTRSDGHGIYIKHDGAGSKVVRDNIIFNQFAFGVHGYTESSGALRNMVFEGNVLFNNGELSDDDNPNLQIGGNRIADNNVVADNMTYFSPGRGWWNFRIGYSSLLNGSTVVRNNYVVGGGEVVEVGYWQNLTWTGNTFVGSGNLVRPNDPSAGGQQWSGNLHYRDPSATAWRFGGTWRTFAGWRQASGWAATDQAIGGTPTVTKVFVRPNQYEPGRANVVIYNWSRQGSVGVDLSGVIPLGHIYEIRNVQRIFDAPVATGTFGGGTVQVPVTGVIAHAPIGGSPNAPIVTGPDFDVFVVTSRAP